MDRRKVVKAKDLIIQMYREFPNLLWSQSSMENVMVLLAEKKASEWPRTLKECELKGYRVRMALRMRTLFRHVKQAQGKKSGWVLKMLAGELAENGKDEAEEGGEGEHGKTDPLSLEGEEAEEEELDDVDEDDDPKHAVKLNANMDHCNSQIDNFPFDVRWGDWVVKVCCIGVVSQGSVVCSGSC